MRVDEDSDGWVDDPTNNDNSDSESEEEYGEHISLELGQTGSDNSDGNISEISSEDGLDESGSEVWDDDDDDLGPEDGEGDYSDSEPYDSL